ncbi:hypothetical protein SAMN05216227_101735 [Pseudorhodobacter antarcticus]|jgi:hypothetical protein|uniref:50S ribosomal protein L35 n=1 Tax=Pseudorhodobacter antarcticus TaxID=1077947 RepID=A0A1H8HJK5_9RHOB|nr:hypothetical protein [Pseudorhodobacter antarcticus]SEN56286.1 hypothetical protein SAMN05216227_101735 [Pseudorhodobacter antarcticus]
MDPDLLLIVGIMIGVLAVPSMLSALSESRAPRVAAIMVLIAGVLVVMALQNKPGGYTIAQIPDVFFKVVGRYVN